MRLSTIVNKNVLSPHGFDRYEALADEFEDLTSYEIIDGSQQSLDSISDDIANAKSRFDVQFFSFEGDTAGWQLAEAMMTAAGNGAHGRALIDSFVLHNNGDKYLWVPRRDRSLSEELASKRDETRKMFKTLHDEGVDVRIQGPTPLGRLNNQRLGANHTKLVLIDSDIFGEQRAYVGGFQPTSHNASWHDMMVRITSKAIAGHPIDALQSHFDGIWGSKPYQKAYASRGTYDFGGGLIIFDTPGIDYIIPFARQLIRRASEEVIIETPYLYGRGIWKDLIRSRAQTSLIAPLHNHHRFGVPSERKLAWAVRRGIKVYRFAENEGMTHERALLADEWSLVGSNAFNGLTAGRLGEIALATPHKGLAKQLKNHLQTDISRSVEQQ